MDVATLQGSLLPAVARGHKPLSITPGVTCIVMHTTTHDTCPQATPIESMGSFADHAGKEALLPRHQRSSSQGLPGNLERQSTTIKALHSRHSSPSRSRGSVGLQSPVRDTQHRLQKTQKLLDVLQFGQLHEQVSGQQKSSTERFLVDVLAAQDYRNGATTSVKQIPPLRKVPELQLLLPPERRHKGTSKHGLHMKGKDATPDGYVPLMETASSVASIGLLDESQLQETAPVLRVSAELLRTQIDGDCSKPQPITM